MALQEDKINYETTAKVSLGVSAYSLDLGYIEVCIFGRNETVAQRKYHPIVGGENTVAVFFVG